MNADILTTEEKENLLKIARKEIELKLFGKSSIEVTEDFPIFSQKRGAFVTLHKNGDLKGCIGHILAYDSLIDTIKEMAYAAAFKDPRFPSLSREEYPDIDIEISVLSPLNEVHSYKDVVAGKHGIIISKGIYKGVLLPQVATEHGFDSETFVSQGCLKAGLKRDEYKNGVKIEVFSANVFGEKI
jgi:AmmeMemoRadiSam system protein A